MNSPVCPGCWQTLPGTREFDHACNNGELTFRATQHQRGDTTYQFFYYFEQSANCFAEESVYGTDVQ